MYLSRLVIHNYRSIKYLDLGFAKGKNVIVGKNNAGKSNIINVLGDVVEMLRNHWNYFLFGRTFPETFPSFVVFV